MEEKAEEKAEVVPKSSLKKPKEEPEPDQEPSEPSESPEKTVASVESHPSSPVPSPIPSPIPERPNTPEPPVDINPLLPPDGTFDIHQFRTTSPIMEDPNEDVSSRRTSSATKLPDKLSPQQSLDSIPSRPESRRGSYADIPSIETSAVENDPRPKSPMPKTPESGRLSPMPPDPTTSQINQGSPSHGKSKTSGKNLTGWF